MVLGTGETGTSDKNMQNTSAWDVNQQKECYIICDGAVKLPVFENFGRKYSRKKSRSENKKWRWNLRHVKHGETKSRQETKIVCILGAARSQVAKQWKDKAEPLGNECLMKL